MSDNARYTRMANIVRDIVCGLVDDEASVNVKVLHVGDHVRLQISVASDDFGKVVGRGGQNVSALRFLMNAVGNKLNIPFCENEDGERFACAHIFIEDPNPRRRGNGAPAPSWRRR